MSKQAMDKNLARAFASEMVAEALSKMDNVQMADQVSNITGSSKQTNRLHVRLDNGTVLNFTIANATLRQTVSGE